jgi:endonuclease YncB( thermonuclease family)
LTVYLLSLGYREENEVIIRHTLIRIFLTVLVAMAMSQQAVASTDISSFAFVQDDGSLKVSGYHIYLYGIYIPPTDQSCYTFVRPIPCGTRASLALDFKIGGDFVHCMPTAHNADGSITASCTFDGEDLSAWMLQSGWAVALPDAPFQYAALEKIARAKGIGIWGVSIDIIRKQR